MNAKHAYRVKYRDDLQGISHKELMTMTPTVTETSSERRTRQGEQIIGSCGGIHPKVIAAQETFARVLAKRKRRNK